MAALSASQANAISLNDHQSNVDTRLVRSRTQAQRDSDRRRPNQNQPPVAINEGLRRRDTARLVEKAAGIPISAAMMSGPSGNGSSIGGGRTTPSGNVGPPRATSSRIEPERFAPHSPAPSVSSARKYAMQHSSPPRVGSQGPPAARYSNQSLGQSQSSLGHSQSSLGHSQSSSSGNSYQLSDSPATRPSPPSGPTGDETTIKKNPVVYSSFAQMGVVTTKAKADDCCVRNHTPRRAEELC